MTTFLDSFHEGKLISLLNLSLFLGHWLHVLRFDPKFTNPGERLNLLASLVAQRGKNFPAVWETQVLPLGQEDPLEKGMATHSSILAWRIPWTEGPGRVRSMGSQRVQHRLSD